MKLDSRILEGKRPLTCIDVEQAREFVGKECIFSDKYENFNNLDKYLFVNSDYSAILSIDDSPNCGDYVFRNAKNAAHYGLILPLEWIKKTEKKYRAFSLNEFLERFKIGNTVTFRMKKGEHVPEAECRVEYTRLITGYETLPENRDIPGKSSILLGGCPPTSLARLFEFYELENEYYFPAVWQPFGMEDKE